MNKVFEKILERLDSYIEDAKSEGDFSYIKPFEIAKIAVQEVAEEYNGGWISCSERLPKAGKRYLVSAIWKDKDFEKSTVYDAVYGSDGLWHSYHYEPVSYKVVAWQPLPQPFKERD